MFQPTEDAIVRNREVIDLPSKTSDHRWYGQFQINARICAVGVQLNCLQYANDAAPARDDQNRAFQSPKELQAAPRRGILFRRARAPGQPPDRRQSFCALPLTRIAIRSRNSQIGRGKVTNPPRINFRPFCQIIQARSQQCFRLAPRSAGDVVVRYNENRDLPTAHHGQQSREQGRCCFRFHADANNCGSALIRTMLAEISSHLESSSSISRLATSKAVSAQSRDFAASSSAPDLMFRSPTKLSALPMFADVAIDSSQHAGLGDVPDGQPIQECRGIPPYERKVPFRPAPSCVLHPTRPRGLHRARSLGARAESIAHQARSRCRLAVSRAPLHVHLQANRAGKARNVLDLGVLIERVGGLMTAIHPYLALDAQVIGGHQVIAE